MREPSWLSLDKLKLLRNDVAAASGYSAQNYENNDRKSKRFDNRVEKSQQSKFSSQNEYSSEKTVYPDMTYASEVASSRNAGNAIVPLQKLVSFRESGGSDCNSEGASYESDSSFEDDMHYDENNEGDENDKYNNEMIRSDTEINSDILLTKRLVSTPHVDIDMNISEDKNRKNINVSTKEYEDMKEIQTPSAVTHSEVNNANSNLKMSTSEAFEYDKILSKPKSSIQKDQILSDLENLTVINTKQGPKYCFDDSKETVESSMQEIGASELSQTATLSSKMNQRKGHEDVNDDVKFKPTEKIKDVPKFNGRNNYTGNESNNDNNYDYNKRYSEYYNISDMNDNHDNNKPHNDGDNYNYNGNIHNNENKRINNTDETNINISDDNMFNVHYTLQDKLLEKNILLLKKNNIENSKMLNFKNECNVENEIRKNRGAGNTSNDRCIANSDKVGGEIDFSGSWRSLTDYNNDNLSYKSHENIDRNININKQNNLNFSIDKFSYENFGKQSSIQPPKYVSSDVNDMNFNLRRPSISSSVPMDINNDKLYPRNLRESVDLSDITFQVCNINTLQYVQLYMYIFTYVCKRVLKYDYKFDYVYICEFMYFYEYMNRCIYMHIC